MNPVVVRHPARPSAKALLAAGVLIALCAIGRADEVATPQQSAPATIMAANPKLDRALIDQLNKGQWENALQTLAQGANPNVRGKDGITPLMLAAQGGRSDVVSALVERDADVNLTNKGGQTALHLATTIGQPKPKKKKFGGFGGLGSMLGGAVLGGGLGNLGGLGSSMGVASSLLGGGGLDSLLGGNLTGLLQGGAFNLAGKSGWSAIIGTALQGDLQSGGAFGVQSLLGGGHGLDAAGWMGLMSAVKGSNADVYSAMGTLAGPAGVAGNAQWSQFLNAAAAGDKSTVEAMMKDEQLAPLLQQATEGFTSATDDLPVNAAKKIATQLIQKGADPKVVDKQGRTAAQMAQARGWGQLVALLSAPMTTAPVEAAPVTAAPAAGTPTDATPATAAPVDATTSAATPVVTEETKPVE